MRTNAINAAAAAVVARKDVLFTARARLDALAGEVSRVGVSEAEAKVPGVLASLAEIGALLETLLPMVELPPEAEVVDASVMAVTFDEPVTLPVIIDPVVAAEGPPAAIVSVASKSIPNPPKRHRQR